MASQYYGTRGDSTKQMQLELNKLGAGLAVDGIWGDKTEAAYQKFFGSSSSSTAYSGGSASASGYNPSFKEYTPMSDGELRRIAELTGLRSHELALNQLQSQYNRNKSDIELTKNRTEQDYTDKANAIAGAFSNKREQLSDYALSRGMGRSTYALDVQNRAHSEERDMLLGNLNEKQRRIEDLDRDISNLSALLAEGVDKLSTTRLEQIEGLISKLKTEQQREAQAVMEYNNNLYFQMQNLKLREQELRDRQAAQQAAAAAAAASKGSSPSGGSSSSAGSSKNGKADSIIGDWSKLTAKGKIEYFERNSAQIRVTDYGLYSDLKRQYDQLLLDQKNAQDIFKHVGPR